MQLIKVYTENSTSKLRKENRINRNLIFSDEYSRAIQKLNENKDCSRIITDLMRKMLEHHDGDEYEDLYFIDSVTNKYKAQTSYVSEKHKVEPTKKMLKMLVGNTDVIGIHNHPNSVLPSISDFHTCQERKYKYGLIACHNGSVYQYKVIGELVDIIIETSIRIYEKDELISLTSLQTYDDIRNAHLRHFKELKTNLLEGGVEIEEVLHYER